MSKQKEERKKMVITKEGANKWTVLSDSGQTYEVCFITRLDELGSMYFEWKCNCPSRKRCKHINFVEMQTSGVDRQAQERIIN